jgi:large repetitive protein
VIASVPANVVQDFALHGNTASTSKDNEVTFATNCPPNANDDPATTKEDNSVTINVLANDTDPEGDPLMVSSVTQPANGSAVLNADNTVTYTPKSDFNGSDSFTYTVADDHGGTDKATVNITVTPVNDAPVADGDSATTAEDTPTNIAVLSDDTDVDGDALSVANTTQPSHGTVSINANGTLSYTPAADFNGSDTFTYTVSDGHGGTATATVNVTVTPVNDAPTVAVAAGGSSCGTNYRSGTINLTVNDPDGLQQTESLKLGATSNNTTLVPNTNSNLTFGGAGATRTLRATALSGRTGTALITVTVSDGTATGTTSLTLKAGGNSNDTLTGTSVTNTLSGTDILLGQNGDDTLRGDPLTGVGGKDLICGGRGNDRLSGGGDADRFEGGSGNDRATDFTPSEGDTKDNTVETF